MRILTLCSGIGAIVLATLALASAPPAIQAPGRSLAPDEMRRAVGACNASNPQCIQMPNPVCGFGFASFAWSPSNNCTSGANPNCAHTASGVYNCARTFSRIFGCQDGSAGHTCNPAAVSGNCGQKYSCTDLSVQCVNGRCVITGTAGCTAIRDVFCANFQSCRELTPE